MLVVQCKLPKPQLGERTPYSLQPAICCDFAMALFNARQGITRRSRWMETEKKESVVPRSLYVFADGFQ